MELKCGAIDTDDYSCRGYYITNFSSFKYTFQADLIIDGQGIYSGKVVFEGTYLFLININSHYHILLWHWVQSCMVWLGILL